MTKTLFRKKQKKAGYVFEENGCADCKEVLQKDIRTGL